LRSIAIFIALTTNAITLPIWANIIAESLCYSERWAILICGTQVYLGYPTGASSS
jgi:hypothetical protein